MGYFERIKIFELKHGEVVEQNGLLYINLDLIVSMTPDLLYKNQQAGELSLSSGASFFITKSAFDRLMGAVNSK